MASCVVETRHFQTLIYFKLAVFPIVSASTVAVELCASVDTDAIVAAVGCFAVVNTAFTVIATETFQPKTSVM